MVQAEELLVWEALFGIWVLLFPAMGFAAGILALAKPKVAGILMLISGISGYVGFFALGQRPHYEFALCALGGLLLVIGGASALVSGKK